VTDSVIDEVRAWQSRPLDALYPILYLDALQVKVKDQGFIPFGRGGVQALISGLAQRGEKVDDADQAMESGDAGFLNHL